MWKNQQRDEREREREGEKRTREKMDKKPKCKRQRTVRKLLQGKEKKDESTIDDSTSMTERDREARREDETHHPSPALFPNPESIPTPCCSAVDGPSSTRNQSQE